MKLVKYVAGDFDLTCNPKECPALVVGFNTIESKQKQSEENPNGEIEVTTLVIFQDGGELIELRKNVPHVSDKIIGKDGKDVHAYFEEYPELATKSQVSKKAFDDLAKLVADLQKKVDTLSSPAQ
jgi:hypothetical protein